MSKQDYFPIDSNKLSTTFPELKHYILKNFRKTLSIKKGRELKFNKDTDLIYLINGKNQSLSIRSKRTRTAHVSIP